MAIRWEAKRPNEVRDYVIDWSVYLDGDTIATSDVTVEGVTLDSDANDDTTVTVWLSGGTDGTFARITNTITTAGGRTETEVFTVRIRATSEPVSLAVAKAHLRVTDDSEDGIICGYLRTAREWVEAYSGHILVKRSVTQSFGKWAPFLELFYRPIIEVTEIAYTDADDAAQTLADYAQTTGRYPFRIYPDEQPSIAENSSITVTFTAGYDEGDEPQILVQAILVLIAGMFDNRGSIPEATANTAAALCDKVRAPVI